MKYPLNEQEFVKAWLYGIGDYDDGDRQLAEALAIVINQAYYSGLEDGRKEAAECKEQ